LFVFVGWWGGAKSRGGGGGVPSGGGVGGGGGGGGGGARFSAPVQTGPVSTQPSIHGYRDFPGAKADGAWR